VKHTLARVASSFCTSFERAASFAILSTNPFPWLIWLVGMGQAVDDGNGLGLPDCL
jgi:hypothetical protein